MEDKPGGEMVAGNAELSAGQLTMLLLFGTATALWFYAEYLAFKLEKQQAAHRIDDPPAKGLLLAGGIAGAEAAPAAHLPTSTAVGLPALAGGDARVVDIKEGAVVPSDERLPLLPGAATAGAESLAAAASTCTPDATPAQAFLRLLSLQPAALLEARATLRSVAELGAIVAYMALADRAQLAPRATKHYSRDVFATLCLLLTAVAWWTSLEHTPGGKLLNRHQTEEWKGYMQVVFLLYHYFEAKELYNAIRLFIAAYVWMTGFGNFSYYWVRRDFSPGRFAQMLWRLNFLVLVLCLALRNSYMLYYICPMHTIFTLIIYGVLAVGAKYNATDAGLAVKFAACFAIVVVMWEIPGVFKAVWRPLQFLVGYTDPRQPRLDPLHEWQFRSGLDRYVWIWGMACALMHPRAERALAWLEEQPSQKRALLTGGVTAATLAVSAVWYRTVFLLPKLAYNAWHPYTSWIPITAYIVLRNLYPSVRNFNLGLFGWLGAITLETYLAQFHIWLATDGPDYQPTKLLALVPGYPLLNFCVTSAIYVALSRRLFLLTVSLKDVVIPLGDQRRMVSSIVMTACVGLTLYGVSAATLMLLPSGVARGTSIESA